MKGPDATKHNPDPAYLRSLIERAELSQERAAALCGVAARMMRYYLAETGKQVKCPYSVQFCLECLPPAAAARSRR